MQLVKDVLKRWSETDLLTYGSAIAFQIIFALIPAVLFGLGLLGFLGLSEIYTKDVLPDLSTSTSPAVLSVINETVRKVLTQKQGFWVTIGAVVAVWEMSGAMRAVMQILDRIFKCERERDFKERYLVSIGLAAAAGVLLIAAILVSFLLPRVLDAPLSWLRYPIAIALMVATVWMLMRVAPADRQPVRVASAGTGLVVLAWLVTSVVFGLYVTQVADYGSIFGNLATFFVLFEYIYFAACAFLTGAVLEAIRREDS